MLAALFLFLLVPAMVTISHMLHDARRAAVCRNPFLCHIARVYQLPAVRPMQVPGGPRAVNIAPCPGIETPIITPREAVDADVFSRTSILDLLVRSRRFAAQLAWNGIRLPRVD